MPLTNLNKQRMESSSGLFPDEFCPLNCNPPIAHCHPLLWGGGILVDHWSTISSSIRGICALLMIWYKDMGVSSVLHKTSFQKILQFWMCEIGHESFCNHYEIYKALKPWDMFFFQLSCCSEIWQVSRWQGCWDAAQILNDTLIQTSNLMA